jgi:hypothetical protein
MNIAPYVYLRQGKRPTSLGSNIGNYLVKSGLFMLAYAKHSVGATDD